MRLIDADFVKDDINLLMKSPWFNDNTNGARLIRKEALEIVLDKCIDEAPTIDAVSVVRCKECKHNLICNHSVQHTTHDAQSITIGYKSVDYCSYGERREHETD